MGSYIMGVKFQPEGYPEYQINFGNIFDKWFGTIYNINFSNIMQIFSIMQIQLVKM